MTTAIQMQTRGRRARTALVSMAAGLAAAGVTAPAHALDYTWFGGSGAWDEPANWGGAGTPGAGDVATLNAGVATLSAARSLAGLALTGGAIAGAGLTVSGNAVLSASTQSGTGTSQFNGNVRWQGNAAQALTGGRVVNSAATTTWGGNTAAGGNSIVFDGGATINNTGVWDDANGFAASLGHGSGGGVRSFNNAGVYNKLGSARTDIGSAFQSAAGSAVNVAAGVLSLNGGGTLSGPINIAAGATLSIGNGSTATGIVILAGGVLAGNGVLQVNSPGMNTFLGVNGSNQFNGTLLMTNSNIAINGNLTVGSLMAPAGDQYGAGTLTVTGGAVWSAGSHWQGTRRFDGDLTLGTVGARGGTVITAGTTTWSGGTESQRRSIQVGFAGAINNTGTWNDSNEISYIYADGSFNNSGVYNKTGGTTIVFGAGVTNTGTIAIQASGGFGINPGNAVVPRALFTNSGLISVAAGGGFSVTSGSLGTVFGQIDNNGTLRGSGTVRTVDLQNNGVVAPGDAIGTLTIASNLLLGTAGQLQFELASTSSFDRIVVSGGSVTFGGQLAVINQGYAPVIGDQFVIMTFNQGAAGSAFDSLAVSGFASNIGFNVSYNPQNVTLTVVAVPEPATWALWLAGLAGFAAFTRNRQRR